MKKIEIVIANKIATPVGSPYIVCGNDNYVIEFAFDSEWSGATEKTARFKYISNGAEAYEDVVFNGVICPVPVLSNITEVNIGVYAGDLTTTTPAKIECRKSILCGGGTHEAPSEDVYNQLLEAINTGLVKGEKGDKGEQGVSGIYVGSGEMPESYNIQIDPNGDAMGRELVRETVLDCMYPVGSYYWSSNNTNPSELFGGTWEQVKDKFVLAAGDSYEAGVTGGSATKTLLYENLPASVYTEEKQDINRYAYVVVGEDGNTLLWWKNYNATPMDIMPPYEVAYCWKRIA